MTRLRWARSNTDGLLHGYRDDRETPEALCGATLLTGMHSAEPGTRCRSCEVLAAVPDPPLFATQWPGMDWAGGHGV